LTQSYIRKDPRTPAKNAGASKKVEGRELFTKIGADFWVEMKKDGLKTDVKSALSQY